ncbi:MAG: NAD(P)H-binding protein [Bacteroidota bacterium]
MRTAIVIGATGLVGAQLVELLLRDTRFEKVKIFVRRSAGISNSKLEEHVVNFEEVDNWKKLITGDVLYSALGSTLRKAGGKEEQYNIDYTYQYKIARTAAYNDVKEYVLISSAGSNPASKMFYTRMKGELERDIQKLPFETIHIIRPGVLLGDREEVRTAEKIGAGVMKLLSAIPGLHKLKPIRSEDVAQAMINATFRHVIGIHSYSLAQVFKLARKIEDVKIEDVIISPQH